MADQKKPEELNEAELKNVEGGATKSLVGDDIGLPRTGKLAPTIKGMESVDDDE